jgi:predicted Zn-dependent protease
MKKIFALFSILTIMLFANISFAVDNGTTSTNWDSTAALNRVNAIGTKILTANKLPSGIVFKVSNEEDINAYANIEKEIYVYKGLLQYVQNDEELAAVISHEMGHIINNHCIKQTFFNAIVSKLTPSFESNVANTTTAVTQQLVVTKLSRSEETEADLTGADLLVNAGYNPLAMISVLNKICGNYIDILQTHPSGEKRIMAIYDYINYNYPDKIKIGFNSESYTKALTVINANVSSRSQAKIAKINKEQKKLKEKKIKRAQKMKNSSNGWTMSYSALKALSYSGN